jgi:hypothetical protein
MRRQKDEGSNRKLGRQHAVGRGANNAAGSLLLKWPEVGCSSKLQAQNFLCIAFRDVGR